MSDITNLLLKWHKEIDRDLPWKNTVNPYFIWVSEIILQQTRVEQGTPYYHRFIHKFPTIKLLAEASQEDVYKVWEGLGYYSRARNMHATAKYIHYELNGNFPKTYAELIQLKGIGPYTAAAISSFAFNEDKAVLDGNVFRVLSRLYGEEAFINVPKNRKLFQALVDQLLPKGKSAGFNQAIMDFGSIQCKPKKPSCSSCKLNGHCSAFIEGRVEQLPKKKKAKAKKNRYFYFLDLRPNGKVFPVIKREGDDIWHGLYSFPYLDAYTKLELSSDLWSDALAFPIDDAPKLRWSTKHILSHQILHCFFYEVEIDSVMLQKNHLSASRISYKWIKNHHDVPWPVVISKYLNIFS